MLLLLLACGGPAATDSADSAPGDSGADSAADSGGDSGGDSGATDTADPLPWDPGEDDPPAPLLDATALGPALETALLRAPQSDPLVFMDTYLPLLDGASGGCPAFQEARPGQIYWIGDACTSEHGFTYDGWAVSNYARNVPGDDGSTCAAWVFYYGFMRITDPAAVTLSGWGTAGLQDCTYANGDHHVDAYLTGDFWTDQPFDSWLDEHVPIEMTWSSRELDGVRALTLEGGYSDLDGEVYAVWLDGLAFGAPDEGACAIEPTGVARLWDTGGARYDVVFDGDTSCDGCGEATAAGAALGTVCADFSPFYDWSGRPWW